MRSHSISTRYVDGGDDGIRTHETFRFTPLAGERLRPLGHVSADGYIRASDGFTRPKIQSVGRGRPACELRLPSGTGGGCAPASGVPKPPCALVTHHTHRPIMQLRSAQSLASGSAPAAVARPAPLAALAGVLAGLPTPAPFCPAWQAPGSWAEPAAAALQHAKALRSPERFAKQSLFMTASGN